MSILPNRYITDHHFVLGNRNCHVSRKFSRRKNNWWKNAELSHFSYAVLCSWPRWHCLSFKDFLPGVAVNGRRKVSTCIGVEIMESSCSSCWKSPATRGKCRLVWSPVYRSPSQWRERGRKGSRKESLVDDNLLQCCRSQWCSFIFLFASAVCQARIWEVRDVWILDWFASGIWVEGRKKKIFYLLVFTFFFFSSPGYKIFYNLSAKTTFDEYFASKVIYVWMLKTTAGRISVWVWLSNAIGTLTSLAESRAGW